MENGKKLMMCKCGFYFCVLVLFDEEVVICSNVVKVGFSVVVYLCNVGFGYEICGIFDYVCIVDFVKVNGDFGWFGGLLKFWLINDK